MSTLVKLSGARIYDPTHGVDGEVRDLYIETGRYVPGRRKPISAPWLR